MTPFTPAVGVAFALQEGLRMLEEEGLDNVYERHARLARATQAGLQSLGFQLYAREGYRSNTVTSAVPPAGLDVAAFRRLLDTKYGVVIAGGQGKMTGKMIRVGHLGAVAEGDVVQVLWAMEQALEELDIAPADGRGVYAVITEQGEALLREVRGAYEERVRGLLGNIGAHHPELDARQVTRALRDISNLVSP
jgi:aspartate aminotransferase-like enzyme